MESPLPLPDQAQDIPLFPLFMDLRGRRVLVLGGGDMATSKSRLLMRSGADVAVVTSSLGPALSALIREAAPVGSITWAAETFDPAQVAGCALVFDADEDEPLTEHARQACHAQGVPFNAVDRPGHCDFTVPARLERAPVVVALSTGGTAPALARVLRQRLEKAIPEGFGRLAQVASACRQRVKDQLTTSRDRQRFWDSIFAEPVADALMALPPEAAITEIHRRLDAFGAERGDAGSVALVGAGPGDPGLLTLHASKAIEGADVILYDALVAPSILSLARRETRLIPVGKRAGQPSVSQDFTNRMMVALAQRGQRVVRLKGGDPFVFGRGGEEAEHLRRHGIAVRIVPGITAAAGIAAQLGIPLTHRGLARSLRLATASCRSQAETQAVDWAAMAEPATTLAIYMGHGQAAAVSQGLQAGGLDPETPVAVIENGTRPEAVHRYGALSRLADCAHPFGDGPVMVLVGSVVALAPDYVAALPALHQRAL